MEQAARDDAIRIRALKDSAIGIRANIVGDSQTGKMAVLDRWFKTPLDNQEREHDKVKYGHISNDHPKGKLISRSVLLRRKDWQYRMTVAALFYTKPTLANLLHMMVRNS